MRYVMNVNENDFVMRCKVVFINFEQFIANAENVLTIINIIRIFSNEYKIYRHELI